MSPPYAVDTSDIANCSEGDPQSFMNHNPLQSVQVRDGRTVTYRTMGKGIVPIAKLHGNPGSSIGPYPSLNYVHATNTRLIAIDRAGYGGSDRNAGHSIGDTAHDVIDVMDAIGYK